MSSPVKIDALPSGDRTGASSRDFPVDDTWRGDNGPENACDAGKESAEDYEGLVVRLNDRWRVIDSLEKSPYRQWILQRRSGSRWHARPPYGSFCQKRETLLRAIREKIVRPIYPRLQPQKIAPASLAVIETLPEEIGRDHAISR